MDIFYITRLLLSPAQQEELAQSLALLKAEDWAGFYQRESGAAEQILFIQTAEEWLDFCAQQSLDWECFCFAFLCQKGKALQIGGYQQDIFPKLRAFLARLGRDTPEIRQWLDQERIDAGCGEPRPFLQAIGRLLSAQGVGLALWEDGLYCDCQYTLALLDGKAAKQAADGWRSENFELLLP